MNRTSMTLILCLPIVAAFGGWTSVAPAAQDDALIGYWKFDELGPDKTATPDASGRQRHGRVHGQPLVEGVIGRAIKFEGYPEQIVEIGDLKLKAPATVAFWLKTRSLCNDRRILSQLDGDLSGRGSVRLQGQLDVWDGKTWQGVVVRKLRHNTWMHLAVVFDQQGRATGYLNGQPQESVPCGFDFDGVKATLGGKLLREHGATYNGLLDEFRIYSRALSAEEIAGLHRAAVPAK